VITIAAVVGVAVLGCLAVLQLLLITGAPLGRFAWGGQHDVLPTRLRIGSAVSIALYALFAVLMLEGVALWVLTAYFALGIVLNAVSRSRPERLVMTPVAVVLAAVCLVLALD
jgi:hypothetical protein